MAYIVGIYVAKKICEVINAKICEHDISRCWAYLLKTVETHFFN